MRCDYYVHALIDDFRQFVQQSSELFRAVLVSLAVAGSLNACPAVLPAQLIDLKLLCPVCRIDDQRLADRRVVNHVLHLIQEHLPRCRRLKALDIHVSSGAFSVNEERIRAQACQCTLSNPLQTVNYDFFCTVDPTFNNLNQIHLLVFRTFFLFLNSNGLNTCFLSPYLFLFSRFVPRFILFIDHSFQK